MREISPARQHDAFSALEEFVFDRQIVVRNAKHRPPIDRRVFDRRRHASQRRPIHSALLRATAIPTISIILFVVSIVFITIILVLVVIIVTIVVVAAARLQCRVRNDQRRGVRVLVEVKLVQQQTHAVLRGDQRRLVTVCAGPMRDDYMG